MSASSPAQKITDTDAASKRVFESLVGDEQGRQDQFEKQPDNIKRFGPAHLALQSFCCGAGGVNEGMAEELKAGCARPTGSTLGEPPLQEGSSQEQSKEESQVILIGKKAPDFTAPGYHQGMFVNLKLSEYLGKWILLCFYPGDFTFV